MSSVLALIVLLSILQSKIPKEVLINEVFYDPFGIDKGCFIELIGQPGTSLDGYYLVGIDGGTGKEYGLIDLSKHKIPSSGFFVIGQDEDVPGANLIDPKADYQNGPDSIELWFREKRVDAVGYGDFSEAIFRGEGEPTFDIAGYSIGRRPDGFDTNNNSVDFVGLPKPSPGKPNLPSLSVDVKKAVDRWSLIKSQ